MREDVLSRRQRLLSKRGQPRFPEDFRDLFAFIPAVQRGKLEQPGEKPGVASLPQTDHIAVLQQQDGLFLFRPLGRVDPYRQHLCRSVTEGGAICGQGTLFALRRAASAACSGRTDKGPQFYQCLVERPGCAVVRDERAQKGFHGSFERRLQDIEPVSGQPGNDPEHVPVNRGDRFSVCDGRTGKELARAIFIARDKEGETPAELVANWEANDWKWDPRKDKYQWKLANSLRLGVASFKGDGTMQIFLGRGVYGRTVVEGWDFTRISEDNGTLTRMWKLDTDDAGGEEKFH